MSESIILVQGKPGAGKSSCCRKALAEADAWAKGIAVRHLSVGEHFRGILGGSISSVYVEAVKRSVQQRDDPNAVMALPSHLLVHALVEEFLRTQNGPGLTLIDGYPKEPELLPLLDRSARERVLDILGCIAINVSDAEAVRRQLERMEADPAHPSYDTEAAILRVKAHNEQTVPVIGVLESLYSTATIDGAQDRSSVSTDFIKALSGHLTRSSLH